MIHNTDIPVVLYLYNVNLLYYSVRRVNLNIVIGVFIGVPHSS